MTTTSDDDGTTPVDPGDAYPVTPAYGSRALGDHDDTETAPIVGLPLVPPPVDPVVTASLDSWPPEPVEPVAPEVAPEAAAPQVPADEHPTVVLAGAAAGAAYVADDVLPAGPVGRTHRAAKDPKPPKEPKPVKEPRSAAAPTAHAARTSGLRRTGPTPLGRVVLPLILALVSGVAIVAGWIHLQDDREASAPTPGASVDASLGPAAPVVGPAPPGSSASSSPTVASESPSPTVSDSPSVSPSTVVSSPPAVVASSPAASPSATASSTAATKVDRSVPVVVLNTTKRVGLAAKVAAQLRKDGWTVVLVGNFRGTLAVTTVYAEGNADAVATMQSDLPTKDRQKPPFGAMNPKRLTVVIGTDYPRT